MITRFLKKLGRNIQMEQLSNKERALQMQINDLTASCIELRKLLLDAYDELEQYKQDNAKLEKQNK